MTSPSPKVDAPRTVGTAGHFVAAGEGAAPRSVAAARGMTKMSGDNVIWTSAGSSPAGSARHQYTCEFFDESWTWLNKTTNSTKARKCRHNHYFRAHLYRLCQPGEMEDELPAGPCVCPPLLMHRQELAPQVSLVTVSLMTAASLRARVQRPASLLQRGA